MLDILNYNIIVLIPVYQEKEAELLQTISAFKSMNAGLAIHLVFIVDGFQTASLASLHKLLGLSDTLEYQTCSTYNVVYSTLPTDTQATMNFHLLVKHQHGGKRDSIALLLQLMMNSVVLNLAELKQRYLDANSIEDLLKKHELSLFIIDSDTYFEADALHYLYHTLWHDNHQDVYCATPALQIRFQGYTDFFSLAQNAEYQIMNQFTLSYLVNGECIASDKLLFGLQACGMLKAAYLMDKNVIEAYAKKATTFQEAMTADMNEDTFLSMLIRDKNPKVIYVPKARASTTLPGKLGNFLIQRKRWCNGNLLQQKTMKRQKIRAASVLTQIKLRSTALIKKICYSPAAYFYLSLCIVSAAWHNYFNLTTRVENFIFCGFLFACTALLLLFNVRKFPRFYDGLALFVTLVSVFVYASLIYLFIQNSASLVAWLALISMGLTPLLTLAVMIRKQNERLPVFSGILAKYLLLEPIFRLIFPIYTVAKLDDLAWNFENTQNNSFLHFQTEAKKLKLKALSKFLVENVVFSALLSMLPIIVILVCFAISEMLQWLVLLFAPLLQEPIKHRTIEPITLPQDAI